MICRELPVSYFFSIRFQRINRLNIGEILWMACNLFEPLQMLQRNYGYRNTFCG